MKAKPKPQVWVLHNMPRSGGTLVSKCLGVMQSHALLSEIHPYAQHALSFNALRQAQAWHGLLEDLNWQKTKFVDAITHLEQALKKANQKLILRDWSHVDYLGPPVTNTPENRPKLLEVLSPHFEIRSIQLVRHPLDTWLSLRRLDLIKKHKIDIRQFLTAYRLYLDKTKSDTRLVYEDFLKAPSEQLEHVCNNVGLNYDGTYQDRWFDFDKVTGDTSNSSSLRGTPVIEYRPRRSCEGIDREWLNDQVNYQYLIEGIYG